jgi:ABC-type glycerol-3-phosphate transport system substrate-binding protein
MNKGKGRLEDMEEQFDIEELVAAASRRPMSRMSFIRRALALGLSVTAVAGLLETIEGPAERAFAASGRKSSSIRFSAWGSTDEQTTIKQVLSVFQQRNPSISVTPELTDWTSYWTKYNADIAAHSTADVQFLTNVPTYAAKGALTEIHSLLAKHHKTVPKGYNKGELLIFQYKKGLYGLPRDNDTKVIFYNKKLFRKAGLSFPTSKWSWSDLRTLAQKLTVRQGSRISQYGFAFETGMWRLYFWENGVELFDSDSNPKKVTFNTPAGAKAIQFMADLINKDKVTPPPSQIVDSTYIGPMFAGGQLAMAFGNHALVPTFVKTSGLEWDVAGMPHFAGHKTVNASGGAGYCISRWTHDMTASYTLWSFLTGPVAANIFASGNDLVPDNPQALHSKAWLSKPYNKVFSQQTKLGHDFPSFPQWADVSNLIDAALDKVWTGEETAKQALPDAAAAAQKGLQGTS